MPPVPAETFEREFRGLAADDRAAFVAALWAARGWETAVEDEVVVAERGDERRRIRVVDPGWFGTPELDDVDTLAAARDRGAVRRAADEAGVAYVPPAELRDLLLYGVDREAAGGLYEEWFDRPLERTIAADEEADGVIDALGVSVPTLTGRRRAVAALLLVALVAAAVAAPMLSGGGGPNQEPITVGNVTPAEVGGGAIGAATPTPTERPDLIPGVTRAGVVDPLVLAEAHVSSVQNRSRVIRVEVTGPPNASVMGGSVARNETTRIVNVTHYRHRGTTTFPDGETGARLGVYAHGEWVYQRLVFGNETWYSRYTLTQRPAVQYDDVKSYLYRYFVGAEEAVVRCAVDNETDCPTYRIEIDGEPSGVLLTEKVEDYEALAIVSDEGIITTIRANYTLPDQDGDGERERVRFALDYEFEDVEISPPEWLPEAKTETGSTATPTPTSTTATDNSTATPTPNG